MKTWEILHDLEQATGNPSAATATREHAIRSFLAYRRDGGENHEAGGRLAAMVSQAIQQGAVAEAELTLAKGANADLPPHNKALIPKLQAILRGGRDPALADDPALSYDCAVELRLLLESSGM
jgi:hypothetical protein